MAAAPKAELCSSLGRVTALAQTTPCVGSAPRGCRIEELRGSTTKSQEPSRDPLIPGRSHPCSENGANYPAAGHLRLSNRCPYEMPARSARLGVIDSYCAAVHRH